MRGADVLAECLIAPRYERQKGNSRKKVDQTADQVVIGWEVHQSHVTWVTGKRFTLLSNDKLSCALKRVIILPFNQVSQI